MSYLFLDTSSSYHLIILSHSDQDFEGVFVRPEPKASSLFLLNTLTQLLGDMSFADLDGLLVGRGPGSLTSLRTALSAAQGICVATSLPVWPISSLRWFCEGALLRCQHPVRVLMDARSDQLYVGTLREGQFELSLESVTNKVHEDDSFKTYAVGMMRDDVLCERVDSDWLSSLNRAARHWVSQNNAGNISDLEGLYLKAPV